MVDQVLLRLVVDQGHVQGHVQISNMDEALGNHPSTASLSVSPEDSP